MERVRQLEFSALSPLIIVEIPSIPSLHLYYGSHDSVYMYDKLTLYEPWKQEKV